ncbi:hypothetical protein VTO42DRAFT_1050 [Malbranchea cinnamomea]
MLDMIGRARYIPKLDLLSGYWQVRMGESSIPKTTFNTQWGKFEWLAMPFGLTNAPATFQTMMNSILMEYNGRFCLVYLDDLLIYSNTLDEHVEHLELVLGRLAEHKLYAKPTKCVIASQSVEFVGHIVGGGEVRPVPAKVDVIKEWPVPKNVRKLHQFLGLTSYYRRYVRGFAKIAAPLSELLKEPDAELRSKKRRPIVWNAACQLAFQTLKDALTSEPVLIQPDPQAPFTMDSDASEWALGCSLMQNDSEGRLRPVAFEGQKLRGAELNYPTHEKELLAIKFGLEKFHNYVDNGQPITVITDHESLQYLQTTKRPSKRLARWVQSFQQYDLIIKYRKGDDNVVPDAISRRPDFVENRPANLSDTPISLNVMEASEDEEKWHSALMQYLRTGDVPNDRGLAKRIPKEAEQFTIGHLEDDEILLRKYDDCTAPYLKPQFRLDLLRRLHREFGHLSNPGLMGVLKPRAFWPGMEKDVQWYVHQCPNCQVAQGSKKSLEREEAQHLVDARIITAIDYATGWPLARAVRDTTEEEIGRFIHEEIFINYGAPREIISDNGTNLVGGAIQHYVHLLKARHRTTTPFHPRTNGKVENLNGTLGRMLTKYLVGKPTRLWDEYLPQALFAT